MSSSTDAVKLALLAANMGPGDEVLVPADTFIATAEAESYIGVVRVRSPVGPAVVQDLHEGLRLAVDLGTEEGGHGATANRRGVPGAVRRPASALGVAMSAGQIRLLHVCGARPNFMKVAPLMAAVDTCNGSSSEPRSVRFSQTLVHTGQQYDQGISDVFFRQLGLPGPGHHLGVGFGSRAAQTAQVLERLERVLLRERPDLVSVGGDVNSTVAAALRATNLGIPVAHVEAGLRSGDRSMPEEPNRLLAEQIAELLFTTDPSAARNLAREGVDAAKIHFVGNAMIDTLERLLAQARGRDTLERLRLTARGCGIVTLHRPTSNTPLGPVDLQVWGLIV